MAANHALDRKESANLARRLKQLRLRNRLTQAELAHPVQTNTNTIARWESGASAPHFRHLPALAKGLGVPLEALFCADDEACLGSVVLSAATMKRIRLEGEPAIREIAGVLVSQMEAALRHARPLLDPPQGPAFARRRVRKKPPASQAERLRGLQERATRLRQERQQADRVE